MCRSYAIAGVFNFNIYDTEEGGEARLQTDRYNAGGEDGYLFSFDQGLSLGANGFVNISAELLQDYPTNRGTIYTLGECLSSIGDTDFECL